MVLVGRLKRFGRDISGNIALMGALTFPILVGVAALAVDVGSLYLERREAQALTDYAALVAAANIDKADTAALLAFSDNGISDVSLASAQDNAGIASTLKVVTGRYVPDPSVGPGARFTPGAEPANAVQVTYRKRGTLYFGGRLMDPPPIATTAVASKPATAAFSIGSRLLSLDNGILNALLGKLLGANLSLSVMDYNALLNADVSLLSFLDALATDLHLTAGTYKDVLGADVTLGRILKVLASISKQNSQSQLALKQMSNLVPVTTGLKVGLSSLVDLGPLASLGVGQGDAALDASVGVMQMVWAAAALANGNKQVALGSGVSLPGLLAVSVNLGIGEPPQKTPYFAVGEPGTLVRTAQTRLLVKVSVGGPSGVLGTLLGASINLPLYLEVAHAEGKLKSASCPAGPGSGSVKVDARPGIAELWVADVSPADVTRFGSSVPVPSAKLVDMPIVKVTGSAHVRIGNNNYQTLTFSRTDINNKTVKSVATRNITQSLVGSLLGDLDLAVKVDLGLLSLGLVVPSNGVIISTVKTLLEAVTAPVDTLLYNLLAVLGVHVGEADLRVHALNCGRPVLVN